MSSSNDPGPGGGTIGGAWGSSRRAGGSPGGKSPTYSSITAINTSVRDNKTILEVRLEKQQGATFNLKMEEIETLLTRLGMTDSHFDGVCACPEGKPVVLITMKPNVDIQKFLYKNESYIVKEGIRTTTIRQAGKKDVQVTVSGLHPNTKDQAVFRYLAAHGKVNLKEKVVYHVYPGVPGSSLCAGKFNGNRSYVMEVSEPMGSYHIIDGEKVSVRYPGQEWSCARCHQFKHICPGKAVARECTAERVMLSEHMTRHWAKIGYKPDTTELNEVDENIELEIQVGSDKKKPFVSDSNLTNKYKAVIVKGFTPDTSIDNIIEELNKHGLPLNHSVDDIVRNEKTGIMTINNLEPSNCIELMEKMHAQKVFGRKIFVTSVVSGSPAKSVNAEQVLHVHQGITGDDADHSEAPVREEVPSLSKLHPPAPPRSKSVANLDDFEFDPPPTPSNVKNLIADFQLPNKRKAASSPESTENNKKDKKLSKKETKNKAKSEQLAARQLVSPAKQL